MTKRTDTADRHSIERVAIVLSELRAGGMERVVVHLATSLKNRGTTPLVICLQSKGVLACELLQAGVEVVEIGSQKSYDFAAVRRLASCLAKFRPNIINIHDYSSLPYVAVSGLWQPRCPLVFTSHGLLYRGFEGMERRYRLFARRLRVLAAVSPEVCERHCQFLNWQGPTFIVPNGVPMIDRSSDMGDRVRRELNIKDEEFVFLAVGNPRAEKAFEDLIAASIIVRESYPDQPFSVLIAGTLSDSEYCRNLEQFASQSGLPGLRLLGFQRDVQRLYSAADSLVVSSRSEGLPMVVLEAMTAGLPIVSTSVGGIPDAVPDGCGLLVDAANPGSLASGMMELLRKPAVERKAMGEAARTHAEKLFSVDAMTSAYIEVFNKARLGVASQ